MCKQEELLRLSGGGTRHLWLCVAGLLNECCLLLCCAEVGYNHFVGRMGYQMPQTAALLDKCRPEG